MIPLSLRVRGLTVFKDVSIDFKSIPGDLVAIAGPNGAGKSSLMESVFFSLYRFLPTRRESSYSYFHGRDAMIEFRFDWHGTEYRSVINLDAPYSSMESFLYDASQNPVGGASGKNRKFDEVVSKLFGDSGMILASSFAAQDKSGNFFTMERGQRKQLFIQMLNQEILTRISKASGARLGFSDSELMMKRLALTSLEEIANQAAPDLVSLTAHQDNTIGQLLQQRQLISELRERCAILKAKADLFPDVKRRITEIQTKIDGINNRKRALQKHLQDNLTILQRADEINGAVTELVTARADVEDRRRSLSQIAGERRQAATMKEGYDRAVGGLREEWLKQQGTLKTTEVRKSEAEIASATIEDVPCKAEGEFAKCKFLTRAVSEKENLDQYQVDILNCRQAMLKIQDDQKALPKPNLSFVTNLDAQISQIEESIRVAERRIRYLDPLAAKVAEIGAAGARQAELENQIDSDEHTLSGLSEDHVKLVAEASESSEVAARAAAASNQATGAEAVYRSLEVSVRDDAKKIAEAEAILARIKEAKEKMEPISREVYLLDRDRRQWALLEKAFGPTGIQSLEIDAAGPTVSAYANDLLFSCFGPRFSLKLITQKLLADGSGFKDEFDAYVIDTERGREGSIAALSGGEKVILSEAISLAVAIFNKGKSGICWESLWRDECTGALDEENAPRYIKMLRRAREMGHFSKVYFVAHQENVRSLADSKIEIDNGLVQAVS